MKTLNLDNLHIVSHRCEPDYFIIGIYREPPSEEYSGGRKCTGWRLYVDTVASGKAEPVWDTWEENFEDITAYPSLYCSSVTWVNMEGNEEIALDDVVASIRTILSLR